MKKGKVKIVNQDEKFDKERYSYLLEDYDNDGTENVDDRYPFDENKSGFVEGSPLSQSITKLIDIKKDLDETMYSTVDKLTNFSPQADVYARTKTPFSIINKLVSKRLLDKNKGLTDLVGTTIAVENHSDLIRLRDRIRKGELGRVLEEEDFYKKPKGGYKAYHYIILIDDIQVELQLKTKRAKQVNELSHSAYKKGILNQEGLLYLMDIVDKADKGEDSSIQLFNNLIKDKKGILEILTQKKYADGGELDQLLSESTYGGASLPYNYSMSSTILEKGGELENSKSQKFKKFKEAIDKAELDKCKELECDGTTRIIDYVATKKGINLTPKMGAIIFENKGEIINGFEPHFWNEVTIDSKEYIIDYRAQMWLGEDAPNGVFTKASAKKDGYRYIGDSVKFDPTISKIMYNNN
tara:strand:- start:4293 stop:5525 length:1233 start_codon:yes stop_codon:yes gene_type:complete